MHLYQIIEQARNAGSVAAEEAGVTYGGLPYSVHLDAVVRVLRTHDYHAMDVICLGYLHDAVEDALVPAETFSALSAWVARVPGFAEDQFLMALQALSHRETRSRSEYLTACYKNPLASLVKTADRVANVESCCTATDFTPKLARIGLKYTKEWEQLHALVELNVTGVASHGLISRGLADRLVKAQAVLGAMVATFYAAEARTQATKYPQDCPF